MHNESVYSNVPIIKDDQKYLERPHIDQLLEKAIQSPIVTVIAGSGYGKTYAVYSFLKKHTGVSCWLQFSERDNHSSRFWENFVRTVTVISKDTASKLEDVGFPETQRQFERYVVIPNADIIPDQKYIFVYDDFHLLQDKSVLRFIERSINARYPNITSIFISRNELTINTVNLLSKGLLATITEDDLRFSKQEMTDYFQMQDIQLSEEAAAMFYHDTEGWAFAIHLAGLSLKNGTLDYARVSMKTDIFKRIEHEIFSVISVDLQQYLIKLSLIEQWTLELLTELSDRKDIIEEMERIGSFIRYDTYLNAYRIHYLFLEYLKSKQHLLTNHEKQDVYRKAAFWCQENNFKIDAMSYYEKAGDYQGIVTIVYSMPLLMSNTIAEFLKGILNRAPMEAYRENCSLYILHSRVRMTLGYFEEAQTEMKKLIATFEGLPVSPYNNRLLFGIYNNLGFCGLLVCVRNRQYDFASYFQKAYYYYSFINFEVSGPITKMNLGSYICRVGGNEPGEMQKFIEAVSLSIPYVSKSLKGCMYGYDDLARAELAYFQDDLHNAEKYALTALYKSREKEQYEIETRALFYLLRISVSQGNQEQIQDIFKQLDAQLMITAYLNRHILYDIVIGWFYIQIEQTTKFPHWLTNDFEMSDMSTLIIGMEILVKVKYLLLEKRYAALLAALKNQDYKYGGPWVFLIGKIIRHIAQAICLYQLEEKDTAFQEFETAYRLAESNALDMPFIEYGRNLHALITDLLRDETYCAIPRSWLEKIYRKSSAYAKKLIMIAHKCQEVDQKQHNPIPYLCRQEMEILTSLSQGFTREEIAENRAISLNTVKRVIQNLYLKLGAVNRADAIRIATAKGLLK
jgi:LuxR family maltose regulon positive regulatory protein